MEFKREWMRGLGAGLRSGLGSVALLGLAILPARLSLALSAHGTTWSKVERVGFGLLLDLSAVVALIGPPVAALTLLAPVAVRWLRGARFQRIGPLMATLPFAFVLYVGTVVAQETKRERGSFPTLFDLAEGGTNATFIEGTLGFARYQRVWLPAAVGLLGVGLLLWVVTRLTRDTPVARWPAWALGVVAGVTLGAAGVLVEVEAQERLSNRFGRAALGDPLSGLVESAFDVVAHRGPSTPRQLVVEAEFPEAFVAEGAARVGWPPARPIRPGEGCWPHPHARPLDRQLEPPTRDPRGRALLDALARISRLLFPPGGPPVAVFQLSLEGFRADDLTALHPSAPPELAPFVSGLYRTARAGPAGGVLAGSRVFQAGVRTVHGLGAMICGLGTFPYNLSFIRDLHPFPVRCASDVLASGGFQGTFVYGSDVAFDGMKVALLEHGYRTVLGQDDLDPQLPKGTWDGITDFALFDEAVRRVGEALDATAKPQLAMVMSLSNHGPFTPPEDLPEEVSARVDEALARAGARADADDRKRLIAYAYTDAAVARFFEDLDQRHLADRAVVMLMADHSTGHAYLWGDGDGDTDAAKAQIPFAIVIPPAFRARVADPKALDVALAKAQALIEEAPLSQNDVAAMLLALLSAYPSVQAIPAAERWHTLGGQLTSPWFQAGGDPRSYLLGINGVSEFFALDRSGARVGGYEDSIFLKTRADRYHVTPRLIPITAMAADTINRPTACSAPPRSAPPPGSRPPPGPGQAPHAGRAPAAAPRR